MKKSKQTKASKHVDGADKLSNLPDPILHLILSGLKGTEEVIRTSILSKRWRYLWTSIPCLDIDYSRGLMKPGKISSNELLEYKFTEFVYWVFLNKSLDLDSFRLSCSYYYNMSTVGRWIHAAVTRNVKQLQLVFCPRNENIEMPHCLVTCSSLEVLRLFLLGGRLSLPDFIGFPFLRVLELNRVTLFGDDLVEVFFKSCPSLEDLSLIACVMDSFKILCISCMKLKNLRIDNINRRLYYGKYLVRGDLQISCPKLVFLELTGFIAYKYFLDSLDSLKKAVIHPKVLDSDSDDSEFDSDSDSEPERMDDTLCEVFAGISHVESLSINNSFVAKCIDPKVDVAVALPNLKTLELTIDCMTTDAVQFLKCFPDLESLHLNIKWDYFLLPYWNLNDTTTMRILTRQLKRVEYFDFYGSHIQLDIAFFFLEHGNALEEMVFSWDDKYMFRERSMETMKELSSFHKASSTVKLISRMKN